MPSENKLVLEEILGLGEMALAHVYGSFDLMFTVIVVSLGKRV